MQRFMDQILANNHQLICTNGKLINYQRALVATELPINMPYLFAKFMYSKLIVINNPWSKSKSKFANIFRLFAENYQSTDVCNQLGASQDNMTRFCNLLATLHQQLAVKYNQSPANNNQSPATNNQPPANNNQPPASHLPTIISYMPTIISHLPTIISHLPTIISHLPTIISHLPTIISNLCLNLNDSLLQSQMTIRQRRGC